MPFHQIYYKNPIYLCGLSLHKEKLTEIPEDQYQMIFKISTRTFILILCCITGIKKSIINFIMVFRCS